MAQNPMLHGYFQAVDQDRSGKISTNELQRALSNGSWRPFNQETCRMMISMFDKDNDGGIGFEEFQSLWNYINDWSNTFRGYDRDNSGSIDRGELKNALTQFGYRLSDRFYEMAIRKFDRSHSGNIKFDDFIQLCIVLQTLTAAFRERDTNQNGVIQIRKEQILIFCVKILRRLSVDGFLLENLNIEKTQTRK